MTDSMTTNKLTEREREAILKALVSYYMGAAHIADALTQTPGIPKGSYYNRKEQCPDEIKRLHAEAKAIAMRERSGDQIPFEARQANVSMELQQEAWDMVQGSLDRLRRIATGGTIEVDGRDDLSSSILATAMKLPAFYCKLHVAVCCQRTML